MEVKTAGDVTATPTWRTTPVLPRHGRHALGRDATGHVVWSRPVASYTGITGDVSRDSPVIDGNELITGDGWDGNKINGTAHVFAVNRTTGTLLWSVQVDTDPASIITGSPTLYNGVVYAGVSSYDESDQSRLLHIPRRGGGAERRYRADPLEDLHHPVQQQRQRLQLAPATTPAWRSGVLRR